ncbi:MAG TPA: DUF971 domain-containing protein [Gemmatimonadales bacterium]|jgi:ATP-binding protein involved in chromosome partitioning
MSPQDKQVPRAIRRTADGIEIDWGDGADRVVLGARALRLACPCAACVDELSGRRTLDPATIPEDIRADALELVGAYGLRIRWSDGHGTGIYTFGWLRGQPG